MAEPGIAAKRNIRDNIRLAVEITTGITLIPALIFTAASACAAANSARSTLEQVGQSKYQSVYQQQLSLWQVAAEHPTLAPVIIGGTDADAARTLTVDFYAYVYSQLAPPSESDGTPRGNATKLGRWPGETGLMLLSKRSERVQLRGSG